MTKKIIPTTELNNCGGKCPLLVHMENGKIQKITGNPDFPDLQPCIKGLHAAETFLSKERLLYPLKRTGKRGSSEFVRISWEEAIDTITREWIRIRDSYGPASRYVHYGWGVSACMSGIREAKRLLSLDGGYQGYFNSYSTACVAYTTPYLYGTSQSGSSYDTLLSSELIILWSHNPAETRFDNLMYWLKKCKAKGIPMIVIDPRKNATAKELGAEWIAVKPGTDAALMDAMAYVIFTEDLYDHDFVNNYCQGFTEKSMPEGSDISDCYFDYLSGKKDGIVKNPVWAEAITGVSADLITDFARRFAHAKPAALLQGYGGQRHLNGEQFTRGGIMLSCLTGNVGIKGGWASGAGYCSMIREPVLPSVVNPVKDEIPVYEWTSALERGDLKMILNLAGNALINQHGDINHTKALLEDETRCEFILCSDIFMTPSAKYADIILPGISMFEGENLTSPWSQGNYITYVNKIMEPLGECREEYEWLKEIARRLNLYQQFTQGHENRVQWLEDVYKKLQEQYEELPSLDVLKKQGIARLSDGTDIVAFKDYYFPTPSGKVEIYSLALASMNNDLIPPIPGYVESAESPGKSDRYPLQLSGWHPLTRTHSVHDNNEVLQKKNPQRLWMNPDDAKKRMIHDLDEVLVYNDRGTIRVTVHVTEEIAAGCVALAVGAWYTPDTNSRSTDLRGCINVLTTLQSTPLAHGNGQHSCLVEVCAYNKVDSCVKTPLC